MCKRFRRITITFCFDIPFGDDARGGPQFFPTGLSWDALFPTGIPHTLERFQLVISLLHMSAKSSLHSIVRSMMHAIASPWALSKSSLLSEFCRFGPRFLTNKIYALPSLKHCLRPTERQDHVGRWVDRGLKISSEVGFEALTRVMHLSVGAYRPIFLFPVVGLIDRKVQSMMVHNGNMVAPGLLYLHIRNSFTVLSFLPWPHSISVSELLKHGLGPKFAM